jgi:hypothetical protein
MLKIEWDYIPELEGRAVFALLGCDECERTYPEHGRLSEAAHLEAELYYGWDVFDGRDLCPSCQVERLLELVR